MTERLAEKQKLEEQWEKETHKKDMIKAMGIAPLLFLLDFYISFPKR